jgi:hypothetical protein
LLAAVPFKVLACLGVVECSICPEAKT